jgi:hypothetical protein
VTELYFEWLRKRLAGPTSGPPIGSGSRRIDSISRAAGATGEIPELESLALAELQAKIDALTSGFLSRRLQATQATP